MNQSLASIPDRIEAVEDHPVPDTCVHITVSPARTINGSRLIEDELATIYIGDDPAPSRAFARELVRRWNAHRALVDSLADMVARTRLGIDQGMNPLTGFDCLARAVEALERTEACYE